MQIQILPDVYVPIDVQCPVNTIVVHTPLLSHADIVRVNQYLFDKRDNVSARSLEMIAKALDLDVLQLKVTINHLVEDHYIEACPAHSIGDGNFTTYGLTPKGEEALLRDQKTY